MRKIFKYKISVAKYEFSMDLPVGAAIVKFAEQHGQLCIWVDVDVTKGNQKRDFYICGSGHEVPKFATYIGTAFLHNGDIGYHLFEVTA